MDEYQKGSREWGSKARKEDKPRCRALLKRALRKEPKELDPFDKCETGQCDFCNEVR
jgi:hypothetical protein